MEYSRERGKQSTLQIIKSTPELAALAGAEAGAFLCLAPTRRSTTGCDRWLLSVVCQAAPQLEGKIKNFYRRLPTKSSTQFWKLTGKNRNNIDETCHTQNFQSSQKCIFKPSDSKMGWLDRDRTERIIWKNFVPIETIDYVTKCSTIMQIVF